ncbi:hypothetical protein JIG36_11210 [Actinoplanes sp. LDG1-06]|uniref:Lipoprotein n=1 Tax=Paractinoplanes ovalisporus TaxID=2810368 RepID=A0ABS2A8G2_9ACTN|nr:hypothetical protein [Actinoplanes ovalisporus]MBM2616125.1 hypothetical protein [Actinoplanes ovalisporus]
MIKRGWLAGPMVAALVMVGGCGPGQAMSVPEGCEPEAAGVTWSAPGSEFVLTQVSLFGPEDRTVGAEGQNKRDEPFRPSIEGVDAPDSWLAALATDLARQSRKAAYATPPEPAADGTGFGFGGDDADHSIVYTGVERLDAGFEVACSPTVRGTFHTWTDTRIGGVACAYSDGVELTAYDRLALKFCPTPVTAPPSATSAG